MPKSKQIKRIPCSGATLPKLLKPLLLKLLSQKAMYGYELCTSFETNPVLKENSANSSAIYRTLDELEGEKKLSSKLVSESKGPARRIYKITKSGKECLKCWENSLRIYLKNLSETLKFLEENK